MKGCSTILSILFCLLYFSAQGNAQDQKRSVHAQAGVALPQAENIRSGFVTGFGLSLPLGRGLALTFDFSYWKSTTENQPGKLMEGKLEITPFLISLEYFPLKRMGINPYFMVGGGFVFSSFKIGQYISIPEVTIRQKIASGPGALLGVGAAVSIVKNLFLFGEAKYLYRQAKGKTIITDMNRGTLTEEFSVDLGSFILHSGIKYYF